MSSATDDVAGNSSNEWNGYNNVGICAVAIMATLYHSHRLSIPKALLVMPFAMHEDTIKFLANGKIKPRHVAALVSSRADLFANFRQRYVSSLAVTLNTIQMLVETKHIQFERDIRLVRTLEIDKKFGERAAKIAKASMKLATLLDASEEELYLNLRVWL